MKYSKILGLLAVAAAALMAFAGTASAELTSPEGTAYSGSIHSSSSGSTSLTGSITVTCKKSTVSGSVSTNDNKVAGGSVSSLTFEECGNNTVTVKSGGTLEINDKNQVFSSGAEVTILTHNILGTIHCIYTTSGTDIGDFTGGTPGSLDIGSKSIPRTETDGFCGEHATWEGTYTVETPGTLLNH